MMKRYYQYVDDVNTGRVLACDALKKAVARFERELAAAKKKSCKWVFDEAKADKVIAFVERLVQWESPFAGQNIHLGPWECFFVAQLYGWRNRKTGKRRFVKALLYMAKKQGKTILASALLLYEILSKAGIEAYSLATRQLVANKSFRNLDRFIAANDEIATRLTIHRSPHSIYVDRTASVYMPLSRDSDLDGLNPAFAHIDELAMQRDGRAYDQLTSGMGTRDERLTLITSTAGPGLDNPLIPEYDYAKKLLDGIIEDDSFLVAIYELDKDDHWDDLSVMQKSCPNLGVSVKLDYFATELKAAKMIPSKAVEYKTKYCNLWQSSVDTWIPDALWGRARKAAKTYRDYLRPEILSRAPCFIALDSSTIWDWTALSRYYYLEEIGRYAALHRFYIPGDQAETKAHIENPAIPSWIERGLVVATPGECIDKEYLYRDLDQDLDANRVSGIVYDPARVRGFEINYGPRCTIVPFSQKVANMSPAAKAWEEAIVNGLIIDDSPVMRWMVSCAINKTFADSGRYQITKNGTGKYGKRIDGVITSIMAFSVLFTQVQMEGAASPFVFDPSKITY